MNAGSFASGRKRFRTRGMLPVEMAFCLPSPAVFGGPSSGATPGWQTTGGAGDVMLLVETHEHLEIPWCMIGSLAVNHWAEEAMATADVDSFIATERVDEAVAAGFVAQRHVGSINLAGRSKVSVQIIAEGLYQAFPSRSIPADVNGILMRVAACADTLAGKVLAYSDKDRRPSRRQKDLADIARRLETHPQLPQRVPAEILERLV